MISYPQVDRGLSTLDHFALPATDLDRAATFYTDVLGGRLVVKGPHPIALDGLFIQFGESHMGLFPQKLPLPPRNSIDSYPRCAFALPTHDFEKVSARIENSPILKQRTDCEKDCGCREGLAFTDSEGNLLELLREEKDVPTRIDHIHLDTMKLQEASNFYSSIFNLSVLRKDVHSAVLGLPSGQLIFLHQVRELSEWSAIPYRERHFAFHVTPAAFHLLVGKLSAKGIVESTDIAQGVARNKGDLNFYFKDPNTPFQLQITNGTSEQFCELFR